jgi:PAS domain S-box-containing protein
MDTTWQEPVSTTATDRSIGRRDDAHERPAPLAHSTLDRPRQPAHAQSGHEAIPAFDAVAIPVVHTDLSGIVTGWNRAAEALFGYSAREALGRPLPIIPPEEEERYALLWQRATLSETVASVAVEPIHKEGHRVSVLLSAAPWDEDGAVIGIVMTLTDLSTQKTREGQLIAQAAMEARQARDAAYIAAVATACHAADDERAIFRALAECTAAWSDSAGVVTRAERCGELVAYASRAADADGPVASLFEACAMVSVEGSGQGAHLPVAPRLSHLREVTIGGAVNAQRHHTLASAPITVAGDIVATLYGAVCGARAPFDERSLATLESAALHAGQAITKARAYQTLSARLDALEAETRQKDDFLATVSHELRTPLTAILGFAHIIVENDALGAARRRGMAEDIVASGGLLLTQVNDLLDIVQLGTGRLTVAPEAVDLTTVIQWCERAVRALMHSKNLQFDLAIPADLPPAHANTARLQQVLLNFLVNAYKFTPTGGTVTLEAREMQGSVAISVRDTGIGIAPEDAARIFEPFARVETDYTRTLSGAGVGLAVARQLVGLMGGTIVLDSTPDVGSTFTVSLKTAAEA